MKVKKAWEDSGYCRVYYKDQRGRLFCLQEETPTLSLWYLCTSDYHEPIGTLPDELVARIEIVDEFEEA